MTSTTKGVEMLKGNKTIDLRSDTVTKPTQAMREAMVCAIVGDDVYGEDPTVNTLQEMSASITGMEAGLFVASGTMGNLTAILSYCARGDEVILGNRSHTFLYEAGGMSALGGVHSHQLRNLPDGSLDLTEIQNAIRPDDPHDPITRLVCLENTHNRCGGTYQTSEYMSQAASLAHKHGLFIHLDGARIFNASVVQGVQVSELTKNIDSVTFCLSKGLCAPVGSVLCGSRNFINKAIRIRKMVGGGMRQAGVLAAAGIVALKTMVGRLAEDHEHARMLATGLRQIRGLRILDEAPSTNMVFVNLDDAIPRSAEWICEHLAEYGILFGITGIRQFRLVTHQGIGKEDIQTTCEIFHHIINNCE